MTSSEILKSFRGKRLLSQEKIAELLGVARQTYVSYENDLIHCELDLILKILKILDVNTNEFNEFLNAIKQDYMSYYGKKE